MPWKETCVMDERMKFVAAWLEGGLSLSALCRCYGVSRKTAYKWLSRYREAGAVGLEDRSRVPHSHPRAVRLELVELVLELRVRYPSWGPKKLRAWLESHYPEEGWPAQSTIGVILDRAGLVVPRRRRRRAPPGEGPLSACREANDVWGIDFKGWFRTGDGMRCDPLSVSDLATRYVIRLQALDKPDAGHVWPVLEAAFREHGRPLVMRSDNGPPFGSVGLGGLSRLSVRLIKAGIRPERIAPGKPQQNGRHERLHRTLKAETASPPAASRRAQQRRFDAFRKEFNEERPHEALGQRPPSQLYGPSPRAYEERPREPDYSDHCEIRRVRSNGEIKWRGNLLFLSEALIGEPVGLEPAEEGAWLIRYGPLQIGWITRDGAIKKPARAGASPRPSQPDPPGKSVTHVPG